MMREVVLGDRPISYLNATAAHLLESARETAFDSELNRTNLIALSPINCLWFTWTGTKIQKTLLQIADSVGLRAAGNDADRGIAIQFEAGVPEVVVRLNQALNNACDTETLATQIPGKRRRKLDYLLAEPLLVQSLAHDALDIAGAEALIRELLASTQCKNM